MCHNNNNNNIIIIIIIIKVSLSRKTSRTLNISQRYKKIAQRKFSTVELGKGNSEKMSSAGA